MGLQNIATPLFKMIRTVETIRGGQAMLNRLVSELAHWIAVREQLVNARHHMGLCVDARIKMTIFAADIVRSQIEG